MTTLIGLSGSLRQASFNSALLRAAAELMPAGIELRIASIRGIPLYDGDLEAAEGIPPAVQTLKDGIAAADGLLFVTPEYNNSIPGVMKNAVDWLSRPAADIRRVFGGKPIGLMGASPGGFGTILSQNAWLPVFRTLGARLWSEGRLLVPRAQAVFAADGSLADPKVRASLPPSFRASSNSLAAAPARRGEPPGPACLARSLHLRPFIVRILLVSDLHYTLPQLDWVVRSAPRFDLVVLAGDQLDISSTVSLDAQSVVILRYLALLQAAGQVVIGSGNHDLTGPDAQGEQSALWLAEARAAGVPTDGDSLTIGDTLVTICPWWDGPAGRAAVDAAARGRRRARPRALGLGLPLAAARLADLLDRQAPLRRRRPRRLDRDARAGPRPHRPRPRVAVQARRLVGRPDRRRPGCSTPAGRSARCRATSTSISTPGTASWRSMMGTESLSLAAERAPAADRLLTRALASVLGLGVARRARPRARDLAVGETGEHVGDHRQAGRVAVLLLQVDQVGGDEVQPLGQADGDEPRDLRVARRAAPCRRRRGAGRSARSPRRSRR